MSGYDCLVHFCCADLKILNRRKTNSDIGLRAKQPAGGSCSIPWVQTHPTAAECTRQEQHGTTVCMRSIRILSTQDIKIYKMSNFIIGKRNNCVTTCNYSNTSQRSQVRTPRLILRRFKQDHHDLRIVTSFLELWRDLVHLAICRQSQEELWLSEKHHWHSLAIIGYSN